MAEKLYTIPVNEAFEVDCECPVCEMRKKIENDDLEFTLGPSYMEDDVRAMTDKTGFCREHVKKMYERGNRLGMALMYQTHSLAVIKTFEKMKPEGKGGFLKKADNSKLTGYLKELSASCFICNRMKEVFDRYIITIMYLWKTDEQFRTKYKSSKGFCMEHYGVLIEYAEKELSGKQFDEFATVTSELFLGNLKRVKEDLDWFIDKFDYRFKNEPWKNSKDALPRMIEKLNGINPEVEEKNKNI